MADAPELAIGHPEVALEADLVARLQRGESAAYQELFLRYRRLVYSVAYRLLHNNEDAHDLLQEVFLTIYRRIGGLRDPARLRAWLCRIAVTRAQNMDRSLRRRLATSTISLDDCTQAEAAHCITTDNPEHAVVTAETRRRIDEALATLPFAFRTVVVLRDIEGLSYEEIAEATASNLGTVKSRLARARETLRGHLHDLVRHRAEARR